jgi:uncharacterized small protein (DUF1192 family)
MKALLRRVADATAPLRLWCARLLTTRDDSDAVSNKIEVAQLRSRVNAMHAEIERLRAAVRELEQQRRTG